MQNCIIRQMQEENTSSTQNTITQAFRVVYQNQRLTKPSSATLASRTIPASKSRSEFEGLCTAHNKQHSTHHGLYRSTSCCISHGPCQWERAIFDPHSFETMDRFSWNFIYNYFQDTTPHAKFQGPMSTWVVWTNSQFDASKFPSFFSFLRHAHKSHLWTHPHAQYAIICRSGQGSASWGLERWNLKFDSFSPP